MLVSMGSWFTDGVGIVAKAAVLPITLPWQITAGVVRQGVTQVQNVRQALAPKPPPTPVTLPGVGGGVDPSAALGPGGGMTGPALSSSAVLGGSNLPLILGGVAAAGLLLVALLRRRPQ